MIKLCGYTKVKEAVNMKEIRDDRHNGLSWFTTNTVAMSNPFNLKD